MNPLYSALLFHPIYYCFLLLLGIVLVVSVTLLSMVGYMRNFIKKPPFPYRITEETWKATEAAVIQDTIHTSSIKSITYSYKDHLTQQEYQAQALHCRSSVYNPTIPPMVLVHGTGGCALSWSCVIDYLTEQCSDLYVLNLPGFSHSQGPTQLLSATDQNIWDFYTSFLEQSFQQLHIHSAILIGHSYGAFQSVKFASRYPSKVQQFILVDCPGIHPTLGNIGPYWALVFSIAFPQCLVRLFGNLAILAAYTFYDLFMPKPILYYDLQIWARSWADLTVAKFFTHESIYTHWHGFLLQEVLLLPMPVAFIYGEHDIIIPPHHATIVSKIADGEVPTYIIQGAGHNPADSKEFAKAFSEAVRHALQIAKPFGLSAKKIATNLDIKKILSFRSTFCWNWTEKLVSQYYTYLHSLAPPTIQAGTIFTVNKAGITTSTSQEVHSHPLSDGYVSQ